MGASRQFGAIGAGIVFAIFALPLSQPGLSAHAQPPPLIPPGETDGADMALVDYLNKLNWDASTRGPLLIISPEEAHVRLADVGAGAHRNSAPRPMADGSFDVDTVAEYFSRKPVGFGSLTVLAPTTMTVLNYRDLPKPNPYVGLSTVEKMRVLEATLTPAQWQQLGSDEGLGVGDLTPEQGEIFAALLPNPFVLRPVLSNGVPDIDAPETPLSPEQRLAVRLSLTKKMDWAFSRGPNTAIGGHSRPVFRHGTAQVKDTLSVFSNKAMGTPIAVVLPNRVKPTQLPQALLTSETPIEFGEDDTVGDLVRRIVSKTGVELLCDPRYSHRRLTSWGKGSPVRAGDLLNALTYALTATWRRVGPAYVLTDDIEGLGVRHARIADWVGQNELLTEAAQRHADQALAGVLELDRAGWSDSDPMRPNEALIAKLDDVAQHSPLRIDVRRSLFVPFAELPSAMQTEVISEMPRVQQENADHPYIATPGAKPAVLRTDGVTVTPSLYVDFVIPGYGKVPADSLQDDLPTAAVLAKVVYPRLGHRSPFARGAVEFPKTGAPMRALLVAPRTEVEVTRAVQEAHHCGFTELWIQTPRNDTAQLPGAIALATANHLAVRAVVRPFQAAAGDSPANRERNILGETTVEYARRKRNELQALEIPNRTRVETNRSDVDGIGNVYVDAWRGDAAVSRLIEKGDYLRGDLLPVQQQIVTDLARIAATPGLAGLVLRDATPLTYRPFDGIVGTMISAEGLAKPNTIHDPLLQLGFSEAKRLSCLREYGFDPIDASPLEEGDRLTVPIRPTDAITEMELPYFRDLGTRTAIDATDTFRLHDAQNGRGLSKERKAWLQGRDESSVRLLQSVIEVVRARNPNLPIATSSEEKPDTDEFWFGSVDLPGTQRVPNPADTPHPLAHASKDYWLDKLVQLRRQAFAESSKAYYALTVASEQSDPAAADREALARLSFGLAESQDWDGIVVDLTQMPSGRASALLQAMPSAAPP